MLVKNKSDYPVIARCTSKHSANESSELDVKLSYNNRVVGVHSYRFAMDDEGICVSDETGGFVTMFSFKVTGPSPDEKLFTWKESGGKVWKYNYEIVPTSGLRRVSVGSLESVLGFPLKGHRHIFNGDKSHKYKKDTKAKYKKLAEGREVILRCLKNKTL